MCGIDRALGCNKSHKHHHQQQQPEDKKKEMVEMLFKIIKKYDIEYSFCYEYYFS